jgi:hypothetical protein
VNDRFSKALVLQTIEQMKQVSESDELWDEFPGIREGRQASFEWAEALANGKWSRMQKAGFGADLRAAAAELRAKHKIDAGNGCAQTTGRQPAYAHGTGSTLPSLISSELSSFEATQRLGCRTKNEVSNDTRGSVGCSRCLVQRASALLPGVGAWRDDGL